MEAIDEFPGVLRALAVLVALVGMWAGRRGIVLFVRGVRHADDARASLWVIRGIRGMAVAVSAGALAGGLLFGETWLLVFGAIFLAEELYETGVVALILRAAQRRERESAEPVSDVSPARARNHGH
jgi:hypothetical protein